MSKSEYSVYQWLKPPGEKEFYEKVREFVSIEEAVKAFKHYTNNVSARQGWTTRVIITDGGDCTCAEWLQGEGIVWPPPPPEGVVVVDMEDPQQLHNTIADAVGEPKK